LAKAKRGGFRNTTCDAMLHAVFEDVVKKTKIDPSLIGDISIGNNL
jgi:acetyl-CoA acyltransferase 1